MNQNGTKMLIHAEFCSGCLGICKEKGVYVNIVLTDN